VALSGIIFYSLLAPALSEHTELMYRKSCKLPRERAEVPRVLTGGESAHGGRDPFTTIFAVVSPHDATRRVACQWCHCI
jgi:hypothetical protein